MKTINIYTFGLVMFGAILYATGIPTRQKVLLNKILTTVNNCIPQNPQGTVPAISGKKRCGPQFFCLAEMSLNTTNDNSSCHLRQLLHQYNNQTGQVKCKINSSEHITINSLLLDIRNCTTAALGNRTRGTHPVVGHYGTPF